MGFSFNCFGRLCRSKNKKLNSSDRSKSVKSPRCEIADDHDDHGSVMMSFATVEDLSPKCGNHPLMEMNGNSSPRRIVDPCSPTLHTVAEDEHPGNVTVVEDFVFPSVKKMVMNFEVKSFESVDSAKNPERSVCTHQYVLDNSSVKAHGSSVGSEGTTSTNGFYDRDLSYQPIEAEERRRRRWEEVKNGNFNLDETLTSLRRPAKKGN